MSGLTRALTVLSVCLLVPASAFAAAAPPLSLPDQLPQEERSKIEEVLRNAFASSRVEGQPHVARPEIFEYLLDHPEFATHVTRALKLARYRIWHDSDGLWLDDGWGVRGRFSVLHSERGMRLMFAWGRYEQKLLPDIRGQAVIAFEYAFRPDGDGRTLVATTTTGFVQVDNPILRALGRLGAPFVQAKADREAGQLLRVFGRVCRAIEDDPAQVYRKVSEQPDVPRQELEEFRQLLRLP